MLAPFGVKPPFIAAMVVPTGIGAAVGGYAGDAGPVLTLLSSVCDVMITHPNVANGAGLFSLPPNALYVEGYGLDQFFKGRWQLKPVRSNRLGVLLDKGMGDAERVIQLNALGAVQAVHGVQVAAVVDTPEPVSLAYGLSPSGGSWGEVHDLLPLLKGAQQLKKAGAEAIALVVRLPEADWAGDVEANYAQGRGVDPIGGIEAILSHCLVRALEMPVAHAPVFDESLSQIETAQVVNPKAAAEYITPTFLPCILQGLARAPQFVSSDTPTSGAIGVCDLDALVVPADALGGVPVLSCLERDIPVISVAENTTVMSVTEPLWQTPTAENGLFKPLSLYRVQNYQEACGVLQALKLGLPVAPGYFCETKDVFPVTEAATGRRLALGEPTA